MRSFEFSLARLGLNRVDILYVHDIGALTHGPERNARHLRDLLEGGLRALEHLKAQGVIGAFGLGVNEVQVCLDVMRRADIDCILLAGRYTLLDRSADGELMALCEQRGTSLVIGGAFNSGILATGPVPGARFNYEPASENILERVRAMRDEAARAGIPLPAAALHFPLQNPNVSTVLVGTAKPASMVRDLDMFRTRVTPEDLIPFDAFAIHP